MRLWRALALLVLACASVAGTPAAQAVDRALFSVASRDLARELANARTKGKGLLVMFETADCSYCAEMRSRVFARSGVIDYFRRHFVLASVRLDDPEPIRDPQGATVSAFSLARSHGLAGTPAFAFFDTQGRLIARHQGALDERGFLALGRYVLAGAYETQPFGAWRRSLAGNSFNSGEVVTRPHVDFAFAGGDGRQRHLKSLRGNLVLLAFGYTQCPDVCPTTMVEMKEILLRLGPEATRVRPVFISVDAGRDTPAMMGSYAAAFDPRISAGVIDAQQLDRLRNSLGLVAERQAAGSTYSIDHSAGFFILDATGRLRLRSDYGQDIALVLADLRRLLATGGKRRSS